MNTSKRSVMRILNLFILVVVCLINNVHAADGRLHQETAGYENDSEIKLIMDVNMNTIDSTVNKGILSISSALMCNNGTVTNVITINYYGGTKKEKKRNYPIKKYLKMWKEIESLGIWKMESPDRDMYYSTTEIQLENILKYYIRCGYKEHMIVIKRAKGIKDNKIRKMQKIFNKVFIKNKF